jgi:hypothetical protein
LNRDDRHRLVVEVGDDDAELAVRRPAALEGLFLLDPRRPVLQVRDRFERAGLVGEGDDGALGAAVNIGAEYTLPDQSAAARAMPKPIAARTAQYGATVLRLGSCWSS